MSRRIRLSTDLKTRLTETEINGEGGFQSLMRKLQAAVHGDDLVLEADWHERMEHYAFDFGSGGWQTLLRQLLEAIEQESPRA